MHISGQNLKKIVVDSGIITQEQFETSSREAQRSGRTVANVMIGNGLITETYLGEILSNYFHVPLVSFSKTPVDDAALHSLPESFSRAKKAAVFMIDRQKRIAKAAMDDPGDLKTIDAIAMKLQMKVEPYLAMPSEMKTAFKEYKKDIREEFSKLIEESVKGALGEDIKDLAKMAEHIPIVTITDSIIEFAVVSNASDIHIDQLAERILVRFRIDGILRDIVELPKEISDAVIARIKILSGLQIDIHFTPQDGRFKFKLEEQGIDVRVSIMPTFYGEKAVLRLLRGSMRPLNLRELGLSDNAINIINEHINKSFGMILVTGPTGSGKTTTLYAVLHILNTSDVNIATIEDPIEYDVPRLNQTQVNAKAGITFANGLRSLMRQNPDIIMVGEIRDNDTVGIALNAAMTGHLVLSTLHTNDAPTAIPRLIDMGGEPFLIASTLNTVIAQRLVRKICANCVTSFTPSPEIQKTIKEQLLNIFAAILGKESEKMKDKFKIPKQLYKGSGCAACSFSGYSGQIGIFEIMNVTPKIKALIHPDVSVNEIKQAAREEGMETMFEDGLAKAEAGITTIEEVFRVIME